MQSLFGRFHPTSFFSTRPPQKACFCRRDMEWNTVTGECQIYMDVDCSNIDLGKNSTTMNTTAFPEEFKLSLGPDHSEISVG